MQSITLHASVRLAERIARDHVDTPESALESTLRNEFATTKINQLSSAEQYILLDYARMYHYRRQEETRLLAQAMPEWYNLSSTLIRTGTILLGASALAGIITYATTHSFPQTLAHTMIDGPTVALLYQLGVELPGRRFRFMQRLLARCTSVRHELKKLRCEDIFRRELACIRLWQEQGKYERSQQPQRATAGVYD